MSIFKSIRYFFLNIFFANKHKKNRSLVKQLFYNLDQLNIFSVNREDEDVKKITKYDYEYHEQYYCFEFANYAYTNNYRRNPDVIKIIRFIDNKFSDCKIIPIIHNQKYKPLISTYF